MKFAALALASLVVPILAVPLLAQGGGGDPRCPPHLPIADAFGSGGLFTYAIGGAVADGVRLEGPTLVCRAVIQIPPQCERQKVVTLPPIETELLEMHLVGVTASGGRLEVTESPLLRSAGAVGPIRLSCETDPISGERRVRFVGEAPSFFDVFPELDLVLPDGSARRFTSSAPFRVENAICGLPAGPEGIDPCQPRPYRHAQSGLFETNTPGAPLKIHPNRACHLPFFVPMPPPQACAGAAGSGPGDGRLSGSAFKVFVADVAMAPIAGVQTMGRTFPPDSFFDVVVSAWQEQGGTGLFAADVLVVPTPSAPSCASASAALLKLDLQVLRPAASGLPAEAVALDVAWCRDP